MNKLVIIVAAAATLGAAVPAGAQDFYAEDSNRSAWAGPDYGYWGGPRGGFYVYQDVPRLQYRRPYRSWGPYDGPYAAYEYGGPYAAYGYSPWGRPYGAYGYRVWRRD